MLSSGGAIRKVKMRQTHSAFADGAEFATGAKITAKDVHVSER
jgi:pyruvate/2-oxoacid:ferredoxin oxidoreductase beta subunit